MRASAFLQSRWEERREATIDGGHVVLVVERRRGAVGVVDVVVRVRGAHAQRFRVALNRLVEVPGAEMLVALLLERLALVDVVRSRTLRLLAVLARHVLVDRLLQQILCSIELIRQLLCTQRYRESTTGSTHAERACSRKTATQDSIPIALPHSYAIPGTSN